MWYNHEIETWVPAKVLVGGSGDIKVMTQSEEEFTTPASSGNLMPLHESSLKSEEDMVKLGDLHEAALLHNLRLRFMDDDIFTFIGPILVAANPYKAIPIYTPAYVQKYFSKAIGQVLPPHVFDLANNAYVNMQRDKENQSVIISGESGAGKTEETKLALNYLAQVAGKNDGTVGKEQLLLASSPILEAFGNAKTTRNNNSSRFGKYLEIHFDKMGQICGGKTIEYLLEKSRVVLLGKGERNYHIFYYLNLQTPEMKKALHFTRYEDFKFLDSTKMSAFEGNKDVSEYQDMVEAWPQLGMPETEVKEIFSIVAGVAYLGNVEFEADDDESPSEVSDDAVLEHVCANFQCDADLLETTLTYRNMQSGGRSIIVIPQKLKDANDSRDGMAKGVYAKLFIWLVQRLNRSIMGDEPTNAIGVLDIFGFEIFEINSFEQLCINLANEKLQNHFNDHIFKLELVMYEKEKLDVSAITFVDNQPCLDMLEKKPTGIFPMLDEECFVPKGSDTTFLQKLQDSHRKNSFFGKAPRGSSTIFVVEHFAGGVSYGVDGFLDKNRDVLQPDIASFLSESKMGLLAELFPPLKPARGRAATLGGQFKSSLQQLYVKLCSTAPHFIKCVKTNQVKQAGVFDSRYCLEQIKYLGLLEVVNIRKQGYPIRRSPEDFMERYSILDESVKDPKALASKVGLKDQWQMGLTMMFMKDEMFFHMETQRGLRLEKSVLIIQGFMKYEVGRKQWQKLRTGLMSMQAVVRGALAREAFQKQKALSAASDSLTAAISHRDKSLLETALAQADDVEGINDKLLASARTLLERINKEAACLAGIAAAMKADKEADIRAALNVAKQLDFKDDMVDGAKALLKTLGNKKAAAARAANVGAVKDELAAAVAFSGDEDAKVKALNLAMSHADEVDLKCDELTACEAALQEIMSSKDGKDAVGSAMQSRDRGALEAAIKAAKEKGDVEDDLLAQAETLLGELTAERNLEKAMSGGNQESLNAAVEAAEAAGVDAGTMKTAAKVQAAKKKPPPGSRQAKFELLERTAELPLVQKLQERSKSFKLQSFEKVRTKDTNLNYTSIPIKRPLLKYTGEDDVVHALEEKAVSLFKSVLGYMGVMNMQYPEMLAVELLQECLDNEVMADEVYLQVLKQTQRNSTDTVKRAWQLLTLSVRTFPPSEDFLPYMEVFLYQATQGTMKSGDDDDGDDTTQMAQACLRKLGQIVASGAKESGPTIEEIEALRNEQPLTINVYFTDNSVKSFQIDEETTTKQLSEMIATSLNVNMIDTYSIYDVSNVADPKVLEAPDNLVETMTAWAKKVKAKGLFGKTRVAVHKLMFSKRLYLRTEEVPSDAVELHLLYSQARGCVIRGKYNVTDTEALLLAALTLQIEYGDHDPNKHGAGFLKNIIQEYIPTHLYQLQKPKVWEADLIKTHEKMVGFTEYMSKQNYIRCCSKFTGYGYTFYVCKQTHLKKVPKTVFLAVNCKGAAIFRTDNKEVVEEFPFSQVQSWSAGPNSVALKVAGKSTFLETQMGDDICKLLKDYAMYLAKERGLSKKRRSKKPVA